MKRRIWLAAALAVAIILAGACDRGDEGDEDGAGAVIATFDVAGEQFRVRIENPQTIAQVRALQRGESTASIPNGKLLPGGDGNEGWSWHVDPLDIEMAEATIELCDGVPSAVEAELDRWLKEVGRYCPWSAKLVDMEEAG